MTQPLHPWRRHLNVAVVCPGSVFDDAAAATGVEGVFELPEGVALQVEACAMLTWNRVRRH
jgi:hypothetical protein